MSDLQLTRKEISDFISRHPLAVVASVSDDGRPQAAVVGIVSNDLCEIFFDTLADTRKCRNLRHDSRAAVTLGWDLAEGRTVQIDGIADEPTGTALVEWKRDYFGRFPDGVARQSWPGITYFRVRPVWLRSSDFSETPPRIIEWRSEEAAFR